MQQEAGDEVEEQVGGWVVVRSVSKRARYQYIIQELFRRGRETMRLPIVMEEREAINAHQDIEAGFMRIEVRRQDTPVVHMRQNKLERVLEGLRGEMRVRGVGEGIAVDVGREERQAWWRGAVDPGEESERGVEVRVEEGGVPGRVEEAGLHVGVLDGDAEAGGEVEGAGVGAEPGSGGAEGVGG